MDAHDSIDTLEIDYDLATMDHIPSSLVVNKGYIPVLLSVGNDTHVGKIDWSKLSKIDCVKRFLNVAA